MHMHDDIDPPVMPTEYPVRPLMPRLNDTYTGTDGSKFAWNGAQWRRCSPIDGQYFPLRCRGD